MIRVQVDGVKQLCFAFDKLSGDEQVEILRTAFEHGANTLAATATQLAPKRTGLLAAGIVVLCRKRGTNVVAKVQMGKGWFAGNTFYAGFQEFGWHTGKRRSHPELMERRKWVQGKHFFANAVRQHYSDVPEKICKEIVDGYERIMQSHD
jgi:HK97 gp10 family phage protein